MYQRLKLIRLIVPLLVCFGLAPMGQAAGPDTDGSIAGSNNGAGVGVLVSRTSGVWNTGTGFEALNHLTSGNQNTATGLRALFSDVNGGYNTATGVYSLYSNTSGFFNSATGAYSLTNNTVGSYNTANGYAALYFNTEGTYNTATGLAALYKNTTGQENTAVGANALLNNTTGSDNTATGNAALYENTTGNFNTATGGGALFNNSTGILNTAIGDGALLNNTIANTNTATGASALVSNTTGGANTAIGVSALSSNTEGNDNTALGTSAGGSITGNGNVCIGTFVAGEAGVDDSTYIRNVNTLTQNFSAGVNDYVTVRLSDGRLGHTAVVSSQRYKQDIKPLAAASQALYALKPVSFRLKKEFDPTQALGFGLIAEEVEQVDPALVYRNAKGQVESVRYEMVNAMLLNEFLKEHRTVQEQDATIVQLKSAVAKQEATAARQQKQIEALTAGLQKVSAQVEMSRPAPQTLVDNH